MRDKASILEMCFFCDLIASFTFDFFSASPFAQRFKRESLLVSISQLEIAITRGGGGGGGEALTDPANEFRLQVKILNYL